MDPSDQFKAHVESSSGTDRFVLAATTKLFDWLRWAVMLGALKAVAVKSQSTALKVISVIGLVLFGIHLVAYAKVALTKQLGSKIGPLLYLGIIVVAVGLAAAGATVVNEVIERWQ